MIGTSIMKELKTETVLKETSTKTLRRFIFADIIIKENLRQKLLADLPKNPQNPRKITHAKISIAKVKLHEN